MWPSCRAHCGKRLVISASVPTLQLMQASVVSLFGRFAAFFAALPCKGKDMDDKLPSNFS
jgi:hypothetical protein